MLMVLDSTGMRNAELRHLQVADIDSQFLAMTDSFDQQLSNDVCRLRWDTERRDSVNRRAQPGNSRLRVATSP